jgi:hypothetical protein
MRLVYVDEAGIGGSRQEPNVVVAGVMVDPDKSLRPLELGLSAIVRRHVPEEFQEGFVLHAKDLFNGSGRGFFDRRSERWPMLETRWAIADELAALPARYDLNICIGTTRPDGLTDDLLVVPKNPIASAHVYSFGMMTLGVEEWMRKNAPLEFCMSIVEDNDAARSMSRAVHRSLQDEGFALQVSAQDALGISLPIRAIREDPLFQAKRPGSVLQLADFCAYIVKRILMGDAKCGRFFEPFKDRISRARRPEAESVG